MIVRTDEHLACQMQMHFDEWPLWRRNSYGRCWPLLPDDNLRPERSQVLCHSRAAVNFFCIFLPNFFRRQEITQNQNPIFYLDNEYGCQQAAGKYLWKAPVLLQTTREIGVVRGPE